ncbi:MAG: radical SAM protein [Nitrospinae bacterium]|nr:radical SAM protein [Nitrospinota bacterium]
MLPDKFRRPVDLIQISASGWCEYKCGFCAAGKAHPPARLFPTEWLLRFITIMAALGLKRARLIGGGEPLLRPDILELVHGLVRIKQLTSVSLSTNGRFLKEKSEGLSQAGLHRLFVTIPSLNPSIFAHITGFDELPRTLDGLEAASVAYKIPASVKMTLVPGVNEGEILPLVDFSVERGLDIYIVETQGVPGSKPMSSETIVKTVGGKYQLTRMEGAALSNNPWKLEGTGTAMKVVTRDDLRTCGACNRLWLTAEGVVSLCNQVMTHVDLNEVLAEEPTDEELALVVAKIAMNKPMHPVARCIETSLPD